MNRGNLWIPKILLMVYGSGMFKFQIFDFLRFFAHGVWQWQLNINSGSMYFKVFELNINSSSMYVKRMIPHPEAPFGGASGYGMYLLSIIIH